DRVVTPYVGYNFELLTPALRIPLRPRFFVTGEALPEFGDERKLANDQNPSRIRGPELNTVLAVEEDIHHFTAGPPGQAGPRQTPFDQNDAVGQGMRTVTQMDPFMFGVKAGASFSFEYRGRQFRIKPSIGWLHYRITARGTMVDPSCVPPQRCTNVYNFNDNGTPLDPSDDFVQLAAPGFLRESIIPATERGVFDGVGPGIDLEMDTGRFGPIGSALLMGLQAYYLPGDRDIFFGNYASFNDQLGNDTEIAAFRVRVAPWIYRIGLGIRFQWLGAAE